MNPIKGALCVFSVCPQQNSEGGVAGDELIPS